MRRVIFLSTFSKSKLALMTLFWSVMFLADVFVIFYGLFELFVAEYLIGLILVVYGIIAIYGNWWHVCVALEQINGHTQLTEPDDPQSASNDPTDPQTQARNLVTDEPASRGRRKKSLTQMLGLGRQSLAEEQMAARRRSLGIDSTMGSRSAADADAIDWSDIDDSLEMHESLNSRRKAMAARHAESTASQADAAAGSADSTDSTQPAKHGYDLRQIPTLRLAAEPSPEERRVPGELAPDDWIDDDETDKIIKETLAKRQAAESQADNDESASVDDLSADESVSVDDTDEHTAHPANSSVDDDDIIPDDFDPNDDQAISKMIAQYDAEQSAKSKSDDDTDDESNDESKSKSDD